MCVIKKSTEIPLCILGVLCFFTILVSQTQFSINEKTNSSFILETPREWSLWNCNTTKIYGSFLKVVIMVSSPIFSIISTLLLLVGVTKRNLYFFLPWILLTCRGLLSVQTLNLWHVIQIFIEYQQLPETTGGDWINFSLYAAVVLFFDLIESFCCFEVFRSFKSVWSDCPLKKIEQGCSPGEESL